MVENILEDLNEDLRPDDILVISLDDHFCSKYFDYISNKLRQKEINVFNAVQAPSNSIIFKVEGHVTLSTVYRAKGNEAASVYVIGVDSIFQNKEVISERNKIFTAITRANAWVSISGLGKYVKDFEKEMKNIVKNQYTLVFKMPDISNLKKISRDLSDRHAKYFKAQRYVDKLAYEMGIDREELLKRLSQKNEKK